MHCVEGDVIRKGTLQIFFSIASGAVLLACGAAKAKGQGPYHVSAQWKIGGVTGWDYLAIDPASQLLYITHGDHVVVIDPSTGRVKHNITGLKKTHGVVFDTSGKYGYISDGDANEVVVFDRNTDAIVDRVPAGNKPDGMVFEPVTQTVWAFNGHSKNATVIDDVTHKVVATVALPGEPEFPVADGKGSIYDNLEDVSKIVHIDAKTHTVMDTWSILPCEGPSGLAIDTEHSRLFSVCDGKMAVVNANSGKIVAMPTIGDGPDAAGFDPKHMLAFSSNGSSGTLTVVHEDSADSYPVVQNLATKRGARTMALNQATGTIYVVTADFGPRPAPTAAEPHPHPVLIPGSFEVLVISR